LSRVIPPRSLRGKANFAGFASTKAAQRILSESIARDLGPRGIHVAYVLIDAVIDVPRMRERLPEVPEEFFIKPPLSPTNFGGASMVCVERVSTA
jgi:NAD(P)-dependent dehydrogenase (short-subunit alcohol dehydrogenase family)